MCTCDLRSSGGKPRKSAGTLLCHKTTRLSRRFFVPPVRERVFAPQRAARRRGRFVNRAYDGTDVSAQSVARQRVRQTGRRGRRPLRVWTRPGANPREGQAPPLRRGTGVSAQQLPGRIFRRRDVEDAVSYRADPRSQREKLPRRAAGEFVLLGVIPADPVGSAGPGRSRPITRTERRASSGDRNAPWRWPRWRRRVSRRDPGTRGSGGCSGPRS